MAFEHAEAVLLAANTESYHSQALESLKAVGQLTPENVKMVAMLFREVADRLDVTARELEEQGPD